MAESVPRHEPQMAPPPVAPEAARPPQGAVTAQGTLAVYEPGSGKLVGEVRVATAEQVREAVRASRAAQGEWARRTFNERRDVLLNQEDIDAAGLQAQQVVDLVSHFNGEERIARRFLVVPYSIPRRSAATYFPEANALVPINHVAERSNTPASKSVVISIRKSSP